jgi:hypothetical protein
MDQNGMALSKPTGLAYRIKIERETHPKSATKRRYIGMPRLAAAMGMPIVTLSPDLTGHNGVIPRCHSTHSVLTLL